MPRQSKEQSFAADLAARLLAEGNPEMAEQIAMQVGLTLTDIRLLGRNKNRRESNTASDTAKAGKAR